MEAKKKIKPMTFKEMLGRLSGAAQKSVEVKPTVSAAVLETTAKGMMKFGYEFTEDTLKILGDYLRGYNLWLCGCVGVGKTFFFDCLSKVRQSRGMDGIVKLSMIETQGWTMDIARDWVHDMRDKDVLIDDLGTEPLMKSWGQEAELFPYLLENRMRLEERRTHLTSNLGIVDVQNRYSKRVSDRFVQYFKMEEMKAKKSRRILRPWKTSENGAGVL